VLVIPEYSYFRSNYTKSFQGRGEPFIKFTNSKYKADIKFKIVLKEY
jgi:hypothetical protein